MKNYNAWILTLTALGVIIALLAWLVPKPVQSTGNILLLQNTASSSPSYNITKEPIEMPISAPTMPKVDVAFEPEATTNIQVFPTASVSVSGSNVELTIKQSPNNTAARSSTIASNNGEHYFFLPHGQMLNLDLSGSNIDISVDSSIADQISTNDTGANNDLELF